MRPTFVLDKHRCLVSSLRSKALPHLLRVGYVLSLLVPFETPWGPVPAGIIAIVESVREDDGTVELVVPAYVPALEPWGRRIILVPYATNDLASTMQLEPQYVVNLEDE